VKLVTLAEGANPIGVPWESYGIELSLLAPCLEPLIFEKSNGEAAPLLAESVEEDVDNLQIIFTIRQGIKFTDGSTLNAEVVAWNLEKMIEAKLLPGITAVEVMGEYKVALHLEYYSNNLLPVLAGRSCSIISKEAFEANGIEWARENPVGTGAFKLSEYVRGSHITFVRNDAYWQSGKPYLDGLEYVFMRDVMTQNIALRAAGDQSIDAVLTTNGEQIEMMRTAGLEVYSLPVGPISLVPSSKNEGSPLANVKVRQAISYALDRESLVAARGFGVLQPAWQQISEGFSAHLPDSYNLSYNLDRARELMVEAGYPDGFRTTLYAQPGLADRDMAVAMQGMLDKIGITAAVEFPDSGGYTSQRAAGWEGMLVQHTRSMPSSARSFELCYGPTSVFNAGLYRPDEMFDLIQASVVIPISQNTREVQDIHKMALENVLVVPTYYMFETWIAKPSVNGAGFAEWSGSTVYSPADVWISAN
jgi:peptide/nickel transport system substrate-binding protein